MFTVDGLISGLDTSSIIEGALALQQSRIDRLTVEKQDLTDEQALFKTVEARLIGLQSSLASILRSSNNVFDSKLATSSDEDALAVSASSRAVAGTYQVQLTQLARAHQIKSSGFASKSDEIPTGTMTIQVGNRAEATVTIDVTNNTLQGLADAINAQVTDVSAAVVDDGRGEPDSYRILLTSKHSGVDNQIAVTNGLDGGTGVQPTFTEPAVQEASDAILQVGNGLGAITISSEDNQFDSFIPGVSIDALQANPGSDIVITVANDTGETVEAIEGFVDSYNEVIDFIDANSQFDTETNVAGPLLGNRSASNVQSTLRAALGTIVDGVNENLRTLTSIGISTTSEGKLSLNRSQLEDIVNGRVDGVGIDDIRRLFAIDGQADNPGIEFLLGTNNTQASPKDPDTGLLLPYEVEITRAAEQARVEASTAMLPSVVVDETNDTFELKIDNAELSLQIPHATYTPAELADQLETLINTSPDSAGREAVVEATGDTLSIASAAYGSSSNIEILAGTANAALGLAGGELSTGVNVAGVFRVQLPGGAETITEQATGSGRILSGDAENEYTAQLQIRSNLVESQIAAPTDAYLTVTRGIGAALDAAISDLLDTQNGELATTDGRYSAEIESLDQDIERVEERLEAQRETMLREFAALESTLAELQSVGDALTASLASLSF